MPSRYEYTTITVYHNEVFISFADRSFHVYCHPTKSSMARVCAYGEVASHGCVSLSAFNAGCVTYHIIRKID
jgi:hypothetical protein